MSDLLNQPNLVCESYFDLYYFDTQTQDFVKAKADSNGVLNIFNTNFDALQSLSGGQLSVNLQLHNNFNFANDYIILKFDFSQSYLYLPKDKSQYYNNLSESNVYETLLAYLRYGSPNQNGLQQTIELSSDFRANNQSSYATVIFSKSETLNAVDFSNFENVVLIPYFISVGEYIPLQLVFDLKNTENYDQKFLGTYYPVKHVTHNKSIADFQTYTFSNPDHLSFLNNNENFLTIINKAFNTPFSLDELTSTGTDVTINFANHSIQYYCGNVILNDTDVAKTTNHAFEYNFPTADITTNSSLPLNLTQSFSNYNNLVNSVSYAGYTTARPTSDVMWENLAILKHLAYKYFNNYDTNTLLTEIDAYRGALNSILTNICNPLSQTNYSSFSGSAVDSFGKFTINVFFRTLAGYADLLREEVSNNDTYSFSSFYVNLQNHMDCFLCDTGPYCFASLQDFLSISIEDNLSYIVPTLILNDLGTYLKNIIPEFIYSKNRGLMRRLQGSLHGFATFLNKNLTQTKFFDPTTMTNANIISLQEYPLATLLIVMVDELMLEQGTSRHQPFHLLQEHFRQRAITTNSLPLLYTASSTFDLTDVSTYTLEDFLTILGNLDIISMSLYSLADAIYEKQNATSLSLKMTFSNFL